MFKQISKTSRRLAVVSGILLLQSFSGQALAAEQDVKVFEVTGSESSESAAKNPNAEKRGPRDLLSIEDVYRLIAEAERKRLKLLEPDADLPPQLMEKWGVQVVSINSTAGGVFLDFRFRVIDPKKAEILFDSRIKPYVEVQGSKMKLGVPSAAKIGALRTTKRGHNIHPGRVYSILFSNPGTKVKAGDKVTVVAGDFRAENMTVREYTKRQFAKVYK